MIHIASKLYTLCIYVDCAECILEYMLLTVVPTVGFKVPLDAYWIRPISMPIVGFAFFQRGELTHAPGPTV